jgi:hypothetical protein
MMQLRYGTTRHKWNAQVVHPIELLQASYYAKPAINK